MRFIGLTEGMSRKVEDLLGDQSPSNAMVINLQTFGNAAGIDGKRTIGLFSPDSSPMEDVLSFCALSGCRHAIPFESPRMGPALGIASRMMRGPAAFFSDPVRTVFQRARSIRRFEFGIDSIESKDAMIDAFSEFMRAEGIDLKSATARAALAVADELAMNALYDASGIYPAHKSSKKGAKKAVSKVRPAVRPTRKAAEMLCATDGERMAIFCRDLYGSLDPAQLLFHLERSLRTGVARTVRLAPGKGAGIGTRMIFEASSSFVFGVRHSRCTVVGGVVDLKSPPRGKKSASGLRSIHFLAD